ncbi:hypothetical protein CULT_1500015 [[Clostridium] ultunense Esp]|nr:hypothetical protein CULT_1500015 [[Clostridium] ultunense Esp]
MEGSENRVKWINILILEIVSRKLCGDVNATMAIREFSFWLP